MVKIKTPTQNYYMDGYLQINLEKAKQVVKKDWDMVFVIDGMEGSGKSVLTQQIAHYTDPTLDISRITFNPESFKKAIDEATKYQAIIYDEGYAGLSSKSSMSAINKAIVQRLTIIREKNLFIFIVLPSFFDLDKYVAIWRSRALISVYTGKGFKRGFFSFYNYDKKKELYIKGKKFYNYKCVQPNFRGSFLNGYMVNEQKYRTKKREESIILENINSNQKFVNTITRKIKQTISQNLKDPSLNLTKKQIAGILGVTTMTIYNYNKKYKEENEKN